MPKYELLLWLLKAIWVLFVFAYGACLGSLTNVIVYRMPRGLSIVSPPSRCPKCDTRLSWRDNIPVFGWLLLRGKCRYCKNPISVEYPVVEAAMGLLFVLFYMIWYVLPSHHAMFLGADWSSMKPAWAALNDGTRTWPEFVVVLFLVGSLFAMTLVDAKTFTIPLWLTWFPALIGLFVHPIHAAWLSRAGAMGPRAQVGWTWAIATPGAMRWDWIGLCIGGVAGLAMGLLLLKTRLIGRSFADYAEWEEKAKAEAAKAEGSSAPAESAAQPDATPSAADPVSNPDFWIAYPHARREMIRELAFLGPCVGLMMAGWYLGPMIGGAAAAPLWLTVLTGVLQGYLIGGGVVWFVRIFGSLAFGKEAMGMGDVHLMAGVGACLGWIDSVAAFFGAAFVGLAWAILGRVLGGRFQRMLPYGPFLAVSTILVLVCKPLVERGLSMLTGSVLHLP